MGRAVFRFFLSVICFHFVFLYVKQCNLGIQYSRKTIECDVSHKLNRCIFFVPGDPSTGRRERGEEERRPPPGQTQVSQHAGAEEEVQTGPLLQSKVSYNYLIWSGREQKRDSVVASTKEAISKPSVEMKRFAEKSQEEVMKSRDLQVRRLKRDMKTVEALWRDQSLSKSTRSPLLRWTDKGRDWAELHGSPAPLETPVEQNLLTGINKDTSQGWLIRRFISCFKENYIFLIQSNKNFKNCI